MLIKGNQCYPTDSIELKNTQVLSDGYLILLSLLAACAHIYGYTYIIEVGLWYLKESPLNYCNPGLKCHRASKHTALHWLNCTATVVRQQKALAAWRYAGEDEHVWSVLSPDRAVGGDIWKETEPLVTLALICRLKQVICLGFLPFSQWMALFKH